MSDREKNASDRKSDRSTGSTNKGRKPPKVAKRKLSTKAVELVTPDPYIDPDEIPIEIRDIFKVARDKVAESAANLTHDDLQNLGPEAATRDLSTTSSDEIVENGRRKKRVACCGAEIQYEVDDKFDDKHFRAKFMSKTMFIMASTLIIPLLWNTYVLSDETVRIYFIDGMTLNLVISGVCVLGLNIAVRKLYGSRIVVVTVMILRTLTLAAILTGITAATEQFVITVAFEDAFQHIEDPTQEEHKKMQAALNPDIDSGMIVTPPAPPAEVHITQKYVHTIPVLWLVSFYIIFSNWFVSAIVLRCCHARKFDPNGIWMFGIGFSLSFLAIVVTFMILLIFNYGKGPKIWDLSQVFVCSLLSIIEAILLPMRWRRLFEGKIMQVNEHDECFVAGRFTI